ncbi:glycoside hydrolase family 104 protein [Enterobacter asburiae]|uniref:glycoside hydrolase family 24 protein n=1 Tax=Enterobacter asburiae TaxID=61645 RepID=UPI002FFBE5E9
METRYPIRNANGKDFDNVDEVLALLRQEKQGRWLSGANNMWHGGIHVSRNTAPWSVLTADTRDGAVPLQCIASGELVAWRVCQDFFMGNLGDKPLQYSPSFLLVRSVHKPTQDASTWLCFYTLYMHLAPLSCYPKWPVYQVTPKGNGLIMRQYSGSEVSGQPAPAEISKARLHSGEQVLVERQETFLLHNGQAEVFGLAQRLKEGAPVGDKFWTSVRPAFMEPLGEQYGYLPGWMSVALKAGQFDTVVCPKVMTAIKAGDAIGFLGKDDVPDGFRNVSEDWFSHIEVFSNDGRMPLFLDNPAQLHSGRQFLLVPEGKPLYQREEKGSNCTFEVVGQTNQGDAADIIPAESATSATDSARVAYLQIRPGTWIRKDDVETVSQNDLSKLKFKAVGQEPVKNQLRSLETKWVIDTFRWLSSQIWAGRDLESKQLQAYYARMADELEKVNIPESIQNENRDSVSDMLHHRNRYVDFFLRRLVVKHESEWHGGSTNPKWNSVLATMSGDFLDYVKQWLDTHEWMSQVPEFSKDEAIWHFHPVEFLAVINNSIPSLQEARVRAFMRMIRVGEGTVGEMGYETLFGGGSFIRDYHKNFNVHPHISVTRGKLTSSAAGAYQVMGYTWDDKNMASYRLQYGVNDFSPKSQDEFCVLIFKYKRKGSLDKIISGDIDGALDVLSYEWASLPPGRYGQPAKTRKDVISIYEKYLSDELNGETDLHVSSEFINDVIKG